MMIPVHVNLGGYPSRPLPPQLVQFGTDEVVLVELQGSLEVEGNLNGQYVGKLTVDGEKVSSCLFAVASVWCRPPQKKSTLRIGHHLLEGKLVNLPKPLAVMHRPSNSLDPPEDDPMDYGDEGPEHARQPPRWDIVAVVKRKMVFAKRPMPMVGVGRQAAGEAVES